MLFNRQIVDLFKKIKRVEENTSQIILGPTDIHIGPFMLHT